jgi:hypothetical protein
MRRFLVLASLIALTLVLALTGAGAAMATVVTPFHPGDELFPLQQFAEQAAFEL